MHGCVHAMPDIFMLRVTVIIRTTVSRGRFALTLR